MIRAATAVLLFVPFLVSATPAAETGSTRRFNVTDFDRVRVQGVFDVRMKTGGAPSASATADPGSLDAVDIAIDGTTLTVRRKAASWSVPAGGKTQVPVVTLSAPLLKGAVVTGGGKLAIAGLKAQRADMAVNGSGALSASAVAVDQLNATIIGTGTMTLAGRAQRAQLQSNGSGSIDATALDVNDLTVRVDGPGATRAAARYTARIVNSGLGQVDIAGNPACTVTAPAGGAVSCGKDR
jgi:hypothetical protein